MPFEDIQLLARGIPQADGSIFSYSKYFTIRLNCASVTLPLCL
jgi:hypothetical protein